MTGDIGKNSKFLRKNGWTFYQGSHTPYSRDGLMPKQTQHFKKLTMGRDKIPEIPDNILNAVKSKDELPSWVIWRMVNNTKEWLRAAKQY